MTFHDHTYKRPAVPVATQSKAWIYGHSLAKIVFSILGGDMDVSREFCVYVVR